MLKVAHMLDKLNKILAIKFLLQSPLSLYILNKWSCFIFVININEQIVVTIRDPNNQSSERHQMTFIFIFLPFFPFSFFIFFFGIRISIFVPDSALESIPSSIWIMWCSRHLSLNLISCPKRGKKVFKWDRGSFYTPRCVDVLELNENFYNAGIITQNSTLIIHLFYLRLENSSALSACLVFYLHVSLRINALELNMMALRHGWVGNPPFLSCCSDNLNTKFSSHGLRWHPQIPLSYLNSCHWEMKRKRWSRSPEISRLPSAHISLARTEGHKLQKRLKKCNFSRVVTCPAKIPSFHY